MKKYAKSALGAAIVVLLTISASMAEDMCRKQVSTTEGPVMGMMEGGSCAYKGIPYARPPVGDLRWRSPEPPAKRDTVLEAVKFGGECSQTEFDSPFNTKVENPNPQEDCLFLNIWRPKKAGTYPVMFWIHGGGFTVGAGSDPAYWGDRLAERKDVVVVTINYRLGVLGFLAHSKLSGEDPHKGSGNYGMLDQVEAMKWVKQNIASFGGNPNNVTIFGESAGGVSVCMHLASPLSAGLFQKAILESGSCNATHTMERGFKQGDEIASKLGCTSGDVISCMRSKPVEQVLATMRGSKGKAEDLLILKFWDHDWASHEDGWAFRENPIKSLRSGNYNKVPFMVGSNKDEAKMFFVEYKSDYRSIKRSVVEEAIANSLPRELIPIFGKLYPLSKYNSAIDAFADATSDIRISCNCFEAAEATAPAIPTYYYRFDYDNSLQPLNLGAAHHFEVPFIFDSIDRTFYNKFYSRAQQKKARPLIETMMNYWTNFAKNSDPNGPGNLQWPKYDLTKRSRMILDLPVHVQSTNNVEKCEFWRANMAEAK